MDFLSLFKKKPNSYYGSESFRHVEKLMSKEKDLLIVSPYIDDYYANYISNRARRKSFHIISSSIKASTARKLHGSKLPSAFGATFLITILNIFLAQLGVFNIYFTFLSLGFGIALILYAFSSRNSIYLKVPRSFVHVKMYIGNSSAIEGSANLTYAGLHKNIERINMISDPGEVAELKRQFWNMWNSS